MTKRRTSSLLSSIAATFGSTSTITPHHNNIITNNNVKYNDSDSNTNRHDSSFNRKSHRSLMTTTKLKRIVFGFGIVVNIVWMTSFHYFSSTNHSATHFRTFEVVRQKQQQAPVSSTFTTTKTSAATLLRSSFIKVDTSTSNKDHYQFHEYHTNYKRILGYYDDGGVKDDRHFTVYNVCENQREGDDNKKRCLPSLPSNNERNQRQLEFDNKEDKAIYARFLKSRELLQADPIEINDCIPMIDWLTNHFPTCNLLHEQGGTTSLKFVKGGGYRDVWALQAPNTIHSLRQTFDNNSTNDTTELAIESLTYSENMPMTMIALKSLQYRHDYTPHIYDRHRKDAIIMEHLTSSPYILNVYAHCGNSVFTDYSEKGDIFKAVYQKSITGTSLRKLEVAVQIAQGLALLHSGDVTTRNNTTFDDGNIYNASSSIAAIVHADFAPSQILNIDGVWKLHDFNCALYLRKNKYTGQSCPFHEKNPSGGVLRSPEEYKNENTTEMVDIFSLGNIFYFMLEEHHIWKGVDHKDVIENYIKRGILPKIGDSTYERSQNDPAVAALIKATVDMCWPHDPKQRSSARDIATFLQNELEKIKHANVKSSM